MPVHLYLSSGKCSHATAVEGTQVTMTACLMSGQGELSCCLSGEAIAPCLLRVAPCVTPDGVLVLKCM